MFRKFLPLLQRGVKSDIVRVFSLTSISTLVKMLTGFVSIKVVSVIIGPAGIALLGQLNNFIQIIQTLAQAGINNGVTKYIAEYKEDESQIKRLISSGFRITLYSSVVFGIVCVAMSRTIAQLIMLDQSYYYLFVILGCFLVLFSINGLILSIINGFELYRKFVLINVINTVAGVVYTVVLVLQFGLVGALIGVVTFQSIMLLTTVYMVRKLEWFTWTFWKGNIDRDVLKKYFHYSVMTFITISTVPISQLLLRSYVITEISEVEAGWWEAMNRLSGTYLMVITSSFMVYYLPKLSKASDDFAIRAEVFKAAKFILPLLLVGLVFIYCIRIFIIKILFSTDFLPMQNLFVWQLLADLFKIASWLLAFVMVAKSQTKRYISVELISGTIHLLIAFWFISHTGSVVGLVQAYTVNYILYFMLMIVLNRKMLSSCHL